MLWQLCKHKFHDELSVGDRSCWYEIQPVWGLHSTFWQEVKDFKLHDRSNWCTTICWTFRISFINTNCSRYKRVVFIHQKKAFSELYHKLPLSCWCVQCMLKLCQFQYFSIQISTCFGYDKDKKYPTIWLHLLRITLRHVTSFKEVYLATFFQEYQYTRVTRVAILLSSLVICSVSIVTVIGRLVPRSKPSLSLKVAQLIPWSLWIDCCLVRKFKHHTISSCNMWKWVHEKK